MGEALADLVMESKRCNLAETLRLKLNIRELSMILPVDREFFLQLPRCAEV